MYGWSLDAFLASLRAAGVTTLVDVRQRRGVRGSEYAWANAKRLQAALDEAGLRYRHEPGLAPTTELRRVQYAEDDRRGAGKRSRTELAAEYTRRFTAEILDGVDLEGIAAELASETAALLCVERDPEACHRSLVADRLARDYGFRVTHLRPEG